MTSHPYGWGRREACVDCKITFDVMLAEKQIALSATMSFISGSRS